MTGDSSYLPTALWLDACLREFSLKGGFYTFIQKGPEHGGAILLKVYVPKEGCQIYAQIRNLEGELEWMEIFDRGWVDEAKADAYISRQIQNDPDLWVVEMEAREKRNPLAVHPR